MATYRITSTSSMGNALPAPILSVAFPAYNGEPCTLSADGLTLEVTFSTEQSIPDLGPLVKVELVPAPSN